jgi:hypothetical protein
LVEEDGWASVTLRNIASLHASTGLYWSKDAAGHGGSVWKVYREGSDGLHWVADADQYGDFIVVKHKSDIGVLIPNKALNVVR